MSVHVVVFLLALLNKGGKLTMDSQEYTNLAQRTIVNDLSLWDQAINAILGMCGESGEIADYVKKHRYHGHACDIEHIKLELGDLLWYVNQMCYACGITLDDVMTANIAKLEKRYPETFNYGASRNRTD